MEKCGSSEGDMVRVDVRAITELGNTINGLIGRIELLLKRVRVLELAFIEEINERNKVN